MVAISNGEDYENFTESQNDFFSEEDLGITTELEVDDLRFLIKIITDIESTKTDLVLTKTFKIQMSLLRDGV